MPHFGVGSGRGKDRDDVVHIRNDDLLEGMRARVGIPAGQPVAARQHFE